MTLALAVLVAAVSVATPAESRIIDSLNHGSSCFNSLTEAPWRAAPHDDHVAAHAEKRCTLSSSAAAPTPRLKTGEATAQGEPAAADKPLTKKERKARKKEKRNGRSKRALPAVVIVVALLLFAFLNRRIAEPARQRGERQPANDDMVSSFAQRRASAQKPAAAKAAGMRARRSTRLTLALMVLSLSSGSAEGKAQQYRTLGAEYALPCEAFLATDAAYAGACTSTPLDVYAMSDGVAGAVGIVLEKSLSSTSRCCGPSRRPTVRAASGSACHT